jgi:Na+/H+-dicarboxylate symporter
MSTYEEHLATRPRAAVYDRWATRVTWMIIPALLVATFSLIAVWMSTEQSRDSVDVVALLWAFTSITLTCCLFAARLVLAALRDAELDS